MWKGGVRLRRRSSHKGNQYVLSEYSQYSNGSAARGTPICLLTNDIADCYWGDGRQRSAVTQTRGGGESVDRGWQCVSAPPAVCPVGDGFHRGMRRIPEW